TVLFNKIINTAPYSFYSIISLKEIAALNKGLSEQEVLAKLISKESSAEFKMDVASETLKDALKRLAVWNSIGHERFATLEIRQVQSLDKDSVFKDKDFAKTVSNNEHKEFIVLNLIRLLHSQDKFINSFKVFQESLGENSLSLNYRLIKYIFPLSYLSMIEKNSSNLDPLIVISLIRQESAFNPEATSRVGAKGLMQLMPATAKRFNRKVKVSHLNNPQVNVTLGAKYLKQLFTRFDGNLIYTLASYNAGENRIDRWKKEIFRNDDPLATIESIPFEETRNYVKLIYRNKFFYSLLSNKSVLTTPVDESFKVTFSN
ncbi:MAG: lytic transglycosylase domain-containing protein, partial [Bdellovibrionales bacterium]|nr:lytic transglycosylase domain-containing protein [Bdellovibrionales bacterium]